MMLRTLLRGVRSPLTSHSYLESAEPTGISNCKQYRTFTFQRCLLSCSLMIYVIFLNLATMTSANPVFVDHTNFGQFQSARNIRNLPCIVRKSGRSGVCMFAIDCIKSNGTHLGTCIDRFYFGSCCQLKDEILYASEISDNSIDQNTISHFVSHETTTLQTVGAQAHKNQNHTLNDAAATNTINKFIHNVTQSYATTATTATEQLTKRPPVQSTTYKNSHFVVRTSTRPIQMRNRTTTTTATTKTTTVKPVRHTTVTTIKPLLTTMQHKIIVDERIEESTMPSKIFTFQMVETTNPSITESLSAEEQIQTTQRTTTTTTSKPKPIVTKRPVIINTTTVSYNIKRNSTATKRPISPKPTKSKPLKINNATNTLDNNIIRTTDKPVTLYRTTTQKPQNTTRTSTTKSPIIATTPTTTQKTTTTTTKTSTTAKPKPTVTKISAKITTTTTTKPKITTTTTVATTTKPATSTTLASTTTKATTAPTTITTTSKATTTATTSTTTTTTTPLPTTTLKTTSSTTTVVPETVITATLATTTTTENRPGLVTWSNLDAEPTTNSSSELDWQPRPPPSDWIIVSTIAPESSTKITQEQTTDKLNIVTSESTIATFVNVSTENQTVPPSNTKLPVLENFTTAPATTLNTTDANMEETTVYIETSAPTMGINNETLTSPTPIMSSFDDVNYKQICGRRMFPEPRIVGGSNAAFGRWPWQVSLRQWRTSTYLHKCGAALLNENWAITAAHCVDNVPPSDLLLRLGEYDLAEEEEPYGYQERRVQIVASHPQFDPRTFEYDLALLRFYEPVIFQPNIIPVCVPDSDYDFIGQTAFVTGWGRLYEDGPLPSVLQEVAVPVINNTICESMYRAAGYIEHIPHIFICAGWKKGGYDSCEGDSGGPMVLQREEDKRFVLGGVISWGIGCAEANQPGVYTRISEFRDWINQILQF